MQSIEDEMALLKLVQFKQFLSNDKCTDKVEIELFLEGVDVNYKVSKTILLEKHNSVVIEDSLLHLAYEKRNIDVFDALICKGADFNVKDKSGCTVLHKSFQSFFTLHESILNIKKNINNLIRVESLFIQSVLSAHVKYKNISNSSDPDGLTHFHIACATNNSEVVKLFLNNGVPVNEAVSSNRFEGYTPLHFAVGCGHRNVVDILLKHGANINLKNGNGRNSLILSLERNIAYIDSLQGLKSKFHEIIDRNEAVMNLLLDHDVDAEFPHLYILSAMQDSSQLESLLAHGIDVNQCVSMDSKIWPGYSPLHFAAQVNVNTVKLLLKHGANVLAKEVNVNLFINMCFDRYKVEDILDIIYLVPLWKDIVLSDGKTKLVDILFALKDIDGIRNFLQKSVENVKLFVPCNSPLFPGWAVLHFAVMLSERIKCKSDYEIRENCINFEPDLTIITECLIRGADVTAMNIFNSTPIHLAFRHGRERTVNLLLEYHHRLKNFVDLENLSHLHIAVKMSNRALIANLLWNDAYVNVTYNGNSFVFYLDSGWTPLHIAAFKGNCEIVKLLLQFGANPHVKDTYSFTPIHILIMHTHSYQLGKILLSLPNLQDCVNENVGLSYLHVACWVKNVDAVKKLLDLGVDINKVVNYQKINNSNYCSIIMSVEARDGDTPLHFALENSYPLAPQKSKSAKLEIVKLLIERGADMLIKNSSGVSPLTRILGSEDFMNCVDAVVVTLKSNHDLRRHIEAEFGLTMLHLACRRVDFQLIKELLDNGANVNAQVHEHPAIWSGYTPLHVLIFSFRCFRENNDVLKIIELLLNHRADVSLLNTRRCTPLHMAYRILRTESDDSSLVELLLKALTNFEVNPTSTDGISHFHIACQTLNVDVVKNFLEHDVDVNATVDVFCDSDIAACSPLLLAIKAVNLREAGSELSLADSFAQLEIVDLLIKHGADVNVEDVSCNTPLHYAVSCCSQREDLLQLLAKNEANVNKRNVQGETPLEVLLKKRSPSLEEIRCFIACGCVFNAFNLTTEVGCIALASSVLTDDEEIPSLLFGTFVNFPDLIKVDDINRTAIHNVVSIKMSGMDETQYVDLFDILMKFGCDIDDQDYLGRTALHMAVTFRNDSAIAALLLAGADINITDLAGRTPFAYAFGPCSRCESADKDHNQYSHVTLFKQFVIQIQKLKSSLLDVNESNEALMDKACERFDSEGIANNLNHILPELNQMMQLKIKPYELTLEDFILDSAAVMDYPTMSFAKRKAIDEFFQTNKIHFQEQYNVAAGIFQLQYRQAVLRRKIINVANDSLSVLLKFRLPDICSYVILRFLKNSELQNLILSTAENSITKVGADS